jgi:hypothetical protein
MRPVLVILAVGFLLMLIAFPVGMVLLGMGTGGIIGVTLLIIAVAGGILAWAWYLAGTYERDRTELIEGEVWARWQLSPDEFRRFHAGERMRSLRLAAAYAAGGTALGVFFMTVGEDRVTGWIMIGAFLLAVIVIITAGGPPWRVTDEAREVRIGSQGVQVLGRYLPLNGPGSRPGGVELRSGDPTELRFSVRTGRRVEEIRVPVPQAHMAEAEQVAERFRNELSRADAAS